MVGSPSTDASVYLSDFNFYQVHKINLANDSVGCYEYALGIVTAKLILEGHTGSVVLSYC